MQRRVDDTEKVVVRHEETEEQTDSLEREVLDERRTRNSPKKKEENRSDQHSNRERPYDSSSRTTSIQTTQPATVENRTLLLTEAAHLTTAVRAAFDDSDARAGVKINKVTPPTAAFRSPAFRSPASPHSTEDTKRAPVPVDATPSTPPSSSHHDENTTLDDSSPTAKANQKRGVPHVYRDYSNVPDAAGYVRKKTGGVTQPFPEKLHELLDRENEPAVVSWLPHGRAFLVRKPKDFTSRVMPKYVKINSVRCLFFAHLMLFTFAFAFA
jgi:hypothetical protein